MRVTLFDCLDSFAWNLVHDLGRLGAQVHVVQEGCWEEDLWDRTDALVLSPGPGLPEEHPQLLQVLAEAMSRHVPVLGVCLGMQAIQRQLGGELLNLAAPLHGRQTLVSWEHVPTDLTPWMDMWHDLPSSMEVGHYHSWVVQEESMPSGLHANARNRQGLVMAMVHDTFPVAGVQFHPESVLTADGRKLLQGWLTAAQRCLANSASKVSLNFS